MVSAVGVEPDAPPLAAQFAYVLATQATECLQLVEVSDFNWERSQQLIEARHLEEKLLPTERSFRVSAHTGAGIDNLAAAVLDRLRQDDVEVSIVVPHSRGDIIAYLRENANVHDMRYETDGAHVRASLSPPRFAKLKALYPAAFPARKKEPWE